jgi:hypothetical protein
MMHTHLPRTIRDPAPQLCLVLVKNARSGETWDGPAAIWGMSFRQAVHRTPNFVAAALRRLQRATPFARDKEECSVAIKAKLHAKLYDTWPAGYNAGINWWRSRFVRWVRSLPSVAHQKRLMAKNAPLVLEINSQIGLGAMLSNTLKLLNYCEQKGFTPYVRFTNPYYAPNPESGEDWLERFFVRKIVPDNKPSILADRFIPYNIAVHNRVDKYLNQSSIQIQYDIFFKYMDIRLEIWSEARQFCAASNIGLHTIGVHYRGTDKSLTQTQLPRESSDGRSGWKREGQKREASLRGFPSPR